MKRPAFDPDAAARCREVVGLPAGAPFRILYLPGHGDVQGTYEQWREGEADRRSLNVTYSHMFYDVAERLDATALLPCEQPVRLRPRSGDRIRFVEVERPSFRDRGSWIRSEMRFARGCRAAVRAFDPHAVIVSNDVLPVALRHICGPRRTVLSQHNTFPYLNRGSAGWRSHLLQAAIRRGLRGLDAAVCVSERSRDQLRMLVKTDLPCAVFVPQTVVLPTWRERTSARRFLFVGRLVRSKGVFDLLHAFRKVASEHGDLSLTFVGDGADLADLRRAVAEDDRAGAIRCLGQLERAPLAAEMAACDVVICPTRSDFAEGLAKPPLEGALFGAPSILSDAVPAEEIMGEAALVYPADDVSALAATISRLVTEPDLVARMSLATKRVRDLQQNPEASWGGKIVEALSA